MEFHVILHYIPVLFLIISLQNSCCCQTCHYKGMHLKPLLNLLIPVNILAAFLSKNLLNIILSCING